MKWRLLAAVLCVVVLVTGCAASDNNLSDIEPTVAAALTPTPSPTEIATPTVAAPAEAPEPAEATEPEPVEPAEATEPEPAEATVTPAAEYVTAALDDPDQLELGRKVFVSTCGGCHGIDGTGSPLGRDLTGIAEEQPDRAVHITSVTWGRGEMLGRADTLTPEEIDAVVSYVRLTFVAK